MIQAPSPQSLTIVGQGQGVTTINSDGTNRVFEINANVVFQDLTITGGKAKDAGSAPDPNPNATAANPSALGGGLLIVRVMGGAPCYSRQRPSAALASCVSRASGSP